MAAAAAADATAAAAHAERPPRPTLFYGLSAETSQRMERDWLAGGARRNDIVITGEYTGDGLAWY